MEHMELPVFMTSSAFFSGSCSCGFIQFTYQNDCHFLSKWSLPNYHSLELWCRVSGVCQIHTIISSSTDENTHSEHIHQSLGVSSDKQLTRVRGFLSSSSFTSGCSDFVMSTVYVRFSWITKERWSQTFPPPCITKLIRESKFILVCWEATKLWV